MKKNLTIFSIVAILASTILLSIPAAFAAFSDVPNSHRYFDAISFVNSEGIVQGYDDGTYKPEIPLNRAEMLKIIVESKYTPSEFDPFMNQPCFNDIDPTQWYTKYVCFAKDQGIVQGYSDGSFKPAQIVNFVEALKITEKGYGSIATEGTPWYKNYVDEASADNLIPLDVTAFNNYFTRGQMAEMITRFVKEGDGSLDTYLGDISGIVNDYNTIASGGFITSDLSNIEVDWNDEVTEVDLEYVVLGKAYQTPNLEDYVIINYQQTAFESIADYYTFYNAGTVTNGEYEGDMFLTIDVAYPTMGGQKVRNGIYDWARNRIIFLWMDDDYESDIETTLMKPVFGSYVPALDFPESLDIADTDLDIEKKPTTLFSSLLLSEVTDYSYLFDVDDFEVYLNNTNDCFLTPKPDGTIQEYSQELDFLLEGDVLDITWLSGVANEGSYSSGEFAVYGACHEIVTEDDVDFENDLIQAGTTSSGDPVYEYNDLQADELVDIYENQYYSEEKMSYNEFLGNYPVVFWQSPLGYWLKFKNSLFIPPVEMGKPVIYLYPEKEIDVNVKVAPNGGFTVTEPEYLDGGWDVRAYPNGRLVNKPDKVEYPYLFWEGKGWNYEMPKEGFVVPADKLSGFLTKSLSRLGLNGQEIADFKEFWLPKMLKANKPYYFVTYMDQVKFEALAPLTVTPRPDTVIRVFMDYKPLDKYMYVDPIYLTAPERDGFTVIEWGGALNR